MFAWVLTNIKTISRIRLNLNVLVNLIYFNNVRPPLHWTVINRPKDPDEGLENALNVTVYKWRALAAV